MATAGPASRGTLLGLEGTVFDGRFRVEELVAEGGFAVVFKAWQLTLERRVALKVLKAPKNQDSAGRAEFREKFAIEAKTIARLRHLHIVDVYDFSVATLPNGELAPWMALEWLDGETLATHLEGRRRAGERGREPGEALDFLRPVLEALSHAHEHGIAHRDIKPSNIMVTETPNGAALRVLDFGIAKIMLDEQTPNTGNTRTESTPAFSPAYAAPEQVAFSRTGPWTDVHALGLILAELMTDEPPFSDPDPDAHLFEQVMARTRPTPASKGRQVGPFEPVLAKALALSPRDRFRSSGELLAALEAAKETNADFVPGASDTAPATVVGNAGSDRPRAPRRRTFTIALAGAVATALVVIGTLWNLPQSNEAPKPEATRPDSTSAALSKTASAIPSAATVSNAAVGAVTGSSAPTSRPVSELPSSEGYVTSVASARVSLPSAPPTRRKPKATPVASSPSANLGDGRDLFNDTK